MFDALEHHNIFVTTVSSGKPESDVMLEHFSMIDSIPQMILNFRLLSPQSLFAFSKAMSEIAF